MITITTRSYTIIAAAAFALWTGLWWGSFFRHSCGWPQKIEGEQNDGGSKTSADDRSERSRSNGQDDNACSFYFSASEFLNVKLTDILLAVFTIILALKTSGLDKATRGLQDAAVEQGRDTKQSLEIASANAEAAQKAADISERALIAAHRPWIKAEIMVGGPITYNINGANVALNVNVTNVGNSPATNVWVDAELVPLDFSVDYETNNPVSRLREKIKISKIRPPIPFGFSVFPGETIGQPIGLVLPVEALKRITSECGGSILLRTVGIVEYRSGFSGTPHATGFIVEVRRDSRDRPISTAKNRSPEAIFPDEGDIPAQDVRLFRSVIEGGYAD